ncbi:U21-ctenitoxin-Pn1a-like [Oppia nitens]|uniref:U21-ctenitoxin-Pn1a-like n=1 Tax=Oppia nitens TaxID=1686743 RepID=UPI0023DB1DA8|nr:U21-ctenitoxin-Pn1a-like [Oppia nitens]
MFATYNKILLFSLSIVIVSVVVLVVNGFHSIIQHYPNVTLETCGIGRQSLLTTGQCLRWGFNSNASSIQYGRLADPGEWPWVVYITGIRYFTNPFYISKQICGGVILNQLWIITAAHCMLENYNYTVKTVQNWRHPGHSYQISNFYLYPDYEVGYESVRIFQHDIALVKLKPPGIQMTLNSDGYYTVNSICLTYANMANKVEELALFAGFGDTDNFVENDGPLRMGWVKIYRHILHNPYGSVIRAMRYPVQTGAGLCNGDSGGPLIQYAGGRRLGYEEKAVLIGINAGAQTNTCLVEDWSGQMFFARVATKVKWIVNTVENN